MKKSKGTLLLLPNLIAAQKHHEVFLPSSVDKAIATIDGLIAENPTEGRRYLGRFETKKPALEIPIATLNRHSTQEDLDFLLEPIEKGERWGVVSDAGLPCIADPGSTLVARAKQKGIRIQGFVGPSSIFLALMLSGLSGQQFFFHGYLDKNHEKLKQSIKKLEGLSERHGATQIFMERPYSNDTTLSILLEELNDETLLCVACDLTSSEQKVLTHSVKEWKKSPLPNLNKRNTLFLFAKAP